MKILHIISSLEVGGAQRLLSDLLPLIIKQNDVSLLVYKRENNDFSKKIENSGIPIISLDVHNYYSPKVVFKLFTLIKGYDIVHVHLFPSLYFVAIATLFRKVKLVYTEHSTSNSRRNKCYFRELERFVYSRYKIIICVSREVQNALQAWLRAKPSDGRFVTIHNGVVIKTFHNIHTKKSYQHTLIMISRFAPSKDQPTVIRALKYLDDNVHLLFVGDGENRGLCEKLAEELNLSKRVHFLGTRSDLDLLISQSDIGIQSSNWEGFGLTAVEIMSSSRPVIATNVDGLKQVVKGAGLLFQVGDDKKLADLISILLSDSKFYNEVSSSCYNRALLYDINIMAEKYLEVYKVLTDE